MSRIKTVLRYPRESVKYLPKAIRGRLLVRFNGLYQKPNPKRVVDESWDVLVILDACRYDVLNAENPWSADCHCAVSQESNTGPWFEYNFLNIPKQQAGDIVYVTANPRVSSANIPTDWFEDLEEVHEYAWDADIGTVHPDDLTDAALRMHDRYPDKRLVAHYIQPHGPLAGSSDPSLSTYSYERLQKGEVSKEYVMEMYSQSLHYALQAVDRLVEHVDGRVVVTADHGESLGEGGLYGHPPHSKSKYLLQVPWIELEGRGTPIPESLLERRTERKTVDRDQRLRDLGYM